MTEANVQPGKVLNESLPDVLVIDDSSGPDLNRATQPTGMFVILQFSFQDNDRSWI